MSTMKPCWVSRNGTRTPIQEMEDGHLCRAMTLVEDGEREPSDDVVLALEAELERRGLSSPFVYRNTCNRLRSDGQRCLNWARRGRNCEQHGSGTNKSPTLSRVDSWLHLGIGSVVMSVVDGRRSVWVRERYTTGRSWRNAVTGETSAPGLPSMGDACYLLVDVWPKAVCDLCGQAASMENLCADHLTKILPPPVERAIVADVPPGPPPARYRPGGDGRQPLVVAPVDPEDAR